MDTFTDQQRRLFLCVIYLFPALLQEISALRCYECNPSSGYSVAGTFSSSSSSSGPAGAFGSSSSSSDCYSPDTRQIKDCAWDIQSCYTVVLPGPQTGIGGSTADSPSSSSSTPSSNGLSPALPNQSQTISRGCGRSPLARPTDVGDDECKVVTIPSPLPGASGSPTRATICNCKSSQCNDKRPDQLPSGGFSSSQTSPWTSMSGSAHWISPWGSGSPYPGMNRDSSAGYGSPFNGDGGPIGQSTSYTGNNQPQPMYFHPNNPPSGYYLPQNSVGGGNGRFNGGPQSSFAIDTRDLPIGGGPSVGNGQFTGGNEQFNGGNGQLSGRGPSVGNSQLPVGGPSVGNGQFSVGGPSAGNGGNGGRFAMQSFSSPAYGPPQTAYVPSSQGYPPYPGSAPPSSGFLQPSASQSGSEAYEYRNDYRGPSSGFAGNPNQGTGFYPGAVPVNGLSYRQTDASANGNGNSNNYGGGLSSGKDQSRDRPQQFTGTATDPLLQYGPRPSVLPNLNPDPWKVNSVSGLNGGNGGPSGTVEYHVTSRAPYTPLQPQGQFGVSQNIPYGNPYTANSGLIVQRGCGKYPGVFEVGDEECRVVTLPGTQTRATVCNCRSDSCNSRRPDQVQNPLTGQSTITTGFYPNAPPSSGPYDPSRQPMGGGGAYQPIGGVGGVYQPPGGPYAQPGQFAYGSGYYPNNQLQPGAQYPFQQYPSTAYGPQQQPGYYNAPVGQPNYNPGYVAGPAPYGPGYAPGQQVPNQYQGGGIGTDPYAYPGRYGGAAALTKPWALCVSTLLLIAVAAGCIR
ncbi:hypothetical protein BV898_03396 [Hypsibius exemplaris]|uniref:Postacrosomal sheath WW domain-binding protein n=1 Tax=Hypsibius exemplaris TaxID=2072580 RepID=A0A1W0X5F2_HYPEX|nr:hypothetical protein BV898_03396 [Hypsibius exemplaris]